MTQLKPSITITKEKDILPGYSNYSIETKVPMGKGWHSSGINFLIKAGYLQKFLYSLHNNRTCFLLYSCPDSYEKEEKIEKGFSLASSAKLIYKKPSKSFILLKRVGTIIYWLVVNQNTIFTLINIISNLFQSYTTIYLIFESDSKADELYTKIKDMQKLGDKVIFPLSSDVIKIDMGCCSAEEFLTISSNHFSKEEIIRRIRESVNLDKVGVVEK